MKKLRQLHLYLGSFFAPLLTFFAVSGIWQSFDFHYDPDSKWVSLLSTLHTARSIKSPKIGEVSTLSSEPLVWFGVLMATGLVLTIALGVAMAWKTGRKRAVLLCLSAGILAPVAIVMLTLAKKIALSAD